MQIFHILFLQFILNCAAEIAKSCNDGKGVCTYTGDCQPISSNFNDLYNNNQIIFCDRFKSIVCCPKVKETQPLLNSNTIFSQVCESYYRKARRTQCEPLPFVVSGIKAEPKEFPHMALLGYKNSRNSINWFCGGTLISEQFVVTAAHCLESTDPVNIVRLGELDYSSNLDEAQPEDYSVSKSYKHPNYESQENDIALIKLHKEVVFNGFIMPACLTSEKDEQYNTFIATGWGATGLLKNSSTHLLKVQLERFAQNECKSTDVTEDVKNKHSFICAGSQTDTRDTCQGDSGGPLVVQHPTFRCLYLLLGVTSYGEFGCGSRRPAVYERVTFHINWIKSIVWKDN